MNGAKCSVDFFLHFPMLGHIVALEHDVVLICSACE